MQDEAIHPAVRVGHVHLRVSDLERALAFYRDALGFAVTADARRIGLEMVLLAAGDYHHHIGLNTWDSAGGTPPPAGHTGLYHVAFLYEGTVKLAIAEGFENGEGGVCAPIRGEIVLGAGSPDRLVLAVSGDSCQDGAGDPTTASFTGLARFHVKQGTGKYAGTSGSGLASFLEDAADQDRMTLIGRIAP